MSQNSWLATVRKQQANTSWLFALPDDTLRAVLTDLMNSREEEDIPIQRRIIRQGFETTRLRRSHNGEILPESNVHDVKPALEKRKLQDDDDRERKRQKTNDEVMDRCWQCGSDFYESENAADACLHHPGKTVPAPSSLPFFSPQISGDISVANTPQQQMLSLTRTRMSGHNISTTNASGATKNAGKGGFILRNTQRDTYTGAANVTALQKDAREHGISQSLRNEGGGKWTVAEVQARSHSEMKFLSWNQR